MEKILVTGAGGFIGSHLTELLVSRGYSVKAFVHYNSTNKWGWLDSLVVKDNIEVISGDIRDYDSVFAAMKGCDTVFHLAALIAIPYSYISPLAYIKTNIEGTYNVLQSSRENCLKSVIITSTSETYGTAQYIPIDENHPIIGQSPYSATKIGADQLALSYYRSYNLPVKIVRPFNTYGPRQSARAIIPSIISQILAEKKEISLGNLTPMRDLTFVKDTVSGFLEIALSEKLYGEIVNIGMGIEISIGDLAEFIAKLMGVHIELNIDKQRVRPGKSEVEQLLCENAKLKKFTKWLPQYTLEAGLNETISWIKKNMEYYKTGIYNV